MDETQKKALEVVIQRAFHKFAEKSGKTLDSEDVAKFLLDKPEELEFLLEAGLGQVVQELLNCKKSVLGGRVSSLLNEYPAGYQGLKSIGDQIDILRGYWPQLEINEEEIKFERPDWAEGILVLVRPGFFFQDNRADTDEILRVLELSRRGKFDNYLVSGVRTPDRYWQNNYAKFMGDKLTKQQPKGDFLFLPIQSGIKYAGYSTEAAIANMRSRGTEFPLGMSAVSTMLITHPHRLVGVHDLGIDCGGDVHWSSLQDEQSPAFSISVKTKGLVLATRTLLDATGRYGTVSGYVSQ